jgi:hypothetical protein
MKGAQSNGAQAGGTMKLNRHGVAAATTYSSASWFSAIFCAAFLSIISASGAMPQTSAEEMTPTEKWVVARVTAGQPANLNDALNADRTKKFPQEEDRKLSAHFLQDLLTGELPGFKPHRNGVRITGAIIDEAIDLTSAQIPCEVWLGSCQFNENVTLARANFTGGLSFASSSFKSFKAAQFHGMKVGGDAYFVDASFDGIADFAWADIASNFKAQGAKFWNTGAAGGRGYWRKDAADFRGIKVGGDADFDLAMFKGPVSFVQADIKGDAFFDSTRFEGGVIFSRADIAGNFEAPNARFQNPTVFFEFTVGRDAFLKRALFEGPVTFARADIAGKFTAIQASFKNKQANFFYRMKVGGDALFEHALFDGPVDFRYADFGSLHLSRVSWPKHAQVQMEGMNFQSIQVVEEPNSRKALLELAEQWSYTPDVYIVLEAFFLRQGYRADADKAFIAGKRREREEYLGNRHWFVWLGSWTLDLLVGYGRRTWQAAIPCAVLIALGCILFSREKMEAQKPEEARRVYNRFWYSLGLFLPIVDLQADTVWKPKADQTFLRNYARVHALLGWILIPIVLAALTGLIK